MVTENEQVVEEKVEAEETPPVETPPAEKPDEETPAEDEDLAQAALDETEDKPKVDPKDAVIGGFRRAAREAELKAARLQGQLDAQQARPPEKSPLELAAEEQTKTEGRVISVDEVIVDGKLLKAQQKWEKDQTGNQARQQATQDYHAGLEAALLTMTDENLGEGLGLQSLCKLGDHLLTDEDHREIFMAGKKCGTVLYKKVKERILKAGGAEAQELQERLKPQTSQPKPKEKQPEKDKTKKEEPPEAEVILDAPAAHIGHVFDLEV